MALSRDRSFDPQLTVEVSLVCQLFPVIAERRTEGLLVKTYLKWLANPENPVIDLIDFTTRWINYEKHRRS